MPICPSKPRLFSNGNTSTLTVDAGHIVTFISTIETFRLNMSASLPTIMTTSSIRHMLSDSALTVLKTIVVGVSTSALRTCSKSMSRVCTVVTDTVLFI